MAQEAATIETAVRLVLWSGSKHTAADLTFLSLDQHGGCPSLGRITVDAVEVLHLRRVRLILGLPPILIICRKGACLAGERPCDRERRDPPAKRAKELTTASQRLRLFLHLRHPRWDRLCVVRSGRQREGLRFNVHKRPAERTNMAVE